jgi:hypothetical protein
VYAYASVHKNVSVSVSMNVCMNVLCAVGRCTYKYASVCARLHVETIHIPCVNDEKVLQSSTFSQVLLCLPSEIFALSWDLWRNGRTKSLLQCYLLHSKVPIIPCIHHFCSTIAEIWFMYNREEDPWICFIPYSSNRPFW